MKKQKMFSATEVAKLLNNQVQLTHRKESNIEHVAKKKPVQLKKAPKRVPTADKKSKTKIKSVPQKPLFGREKIKSQPKKIPVKKEIVSKMPKPPKKEDLPKKRPANFFLKLLNGFKKKRV